MNAWANIKAIMKRELGGYFTSPIAYVFLVIFLLLTGFSLSPSATSSSAAKPRSSRSSPGTRGSICSWCPRSACACGRKSGAWARWNCCSRCRSRPGRRSSASSSRRGCSSALALALTFPVVITVNWLGDPDNGVIFAGYVGSLLLAGAYLAISCMTSAMTRNQVISFILSVMICLFLILAGYTPVTDLLTRFANPVVVQVIAAFSVMTHFEGFQRGVLDTRDVVFFASVIGFALFTTGVIIRNQRAG